jgi:uncharacterized membrane protein YphA (DoxX/SURF4 family)
VVGIFTAPAAIVAAAAMIIVTLLMVASRNFRTRIAQIQ